MNIRLMLCMALVCLAGTCFGEEHAKVEPPRLELTMSALEIADVALAQFKKDRPEADTKIYSVSIEETETDFRVEFFPTPKPAKIEIDANGMPFIMMPVVYKNTIIYVISKRNATIVETLYPK